MFWVIVVSLLALSLSLTLNSLHQPLHILLSIEDRPGMKSAARARMMTMISMALVLANCGDVAFAQSCSAQSLRNGGLNYPDSTPTSSAPGGAGYCCNGPFTSNAVRYPDCCTTAWLSCQGGQSLAEECQQAASSLTADCGTIPECVAFVECLNAACSEQSECNRACPICSGQNCECDRTSSRSRQYCCDKTGPLYDPGYAHQVPLHAGVVRGDRLLCRSSGL